jgi:hypothetical protein
MPGGGVDSPVVPLFVRPAFSQGNQGGVIGMADASKFDAVKVFSATKAREREELGELITRLARRITRSSTVVEQGRHAVERQRVPLPDGHDLLPTPEGLGPCEPWLPSPEADD